MSSLFVPLEEGPFTLIKTPRFETGKTDQYTTAATEMALVHNIFMRCFNSVYKHALKVQPSEYKAFINYGYACYVGLDAHHSGEETKFFPWIEEAVGEKGVMDSNLAQHQAFHDPVHKFGTYLKSFLDGSTPISSFSGAHLRSLIDAFAEPLNQHLHDEIPTLLGLARFGDALDLVGLSAKEAQEVIGALSKTDVMPGALMNHDVTFEGGIHKGFPPIPAPVDWFLRHICSLRHWSWWKYASCDTYGRPKDA